MCATSLRSFRSEEHTSELQSLRHLVCRLLLEKKNKKKKKTNTTTRLMSTRATEAPSGAGEWWMVDVRVVVLSCDTLLVLSFFFFFFFNDTATTEIYTLSLHDALPIYPRAFAQRFMAGSAAAQLRGDRVI